MLTKAKEDAQHTRKDLLAIEKIATQADLDSVSNHEHESDALLNTELLANALGDAGYEFLPSVWATCSMDDQGPTERVLDYLRSCSIQHKVLNSPTPTELQSLTGMPQIGINRGRFVSPYSGRTENPAQANAAVSIECLIILENRKTEKTNEYKANLGFAEFARRLSKATWISECLSPVKQNIRWVALTSVLIHVLGLATAIFSIQVYDRIIPNQAFASLGALLTGLVICLIGDFYLKKARHDLLEVTATLSDHICSNRLADTLLAQHAQPVDSPTFQQHLRSFDTLRELLTGTFILTVVDLPFTAVFLAVLLIIHPMLSLVALMAMVISGVILIGRHRLITDFGADLYANQKTNQTTWFDCIDQANVIRAQAAQGPIKRVLTQTQGALREAGTQVRNSMHESTLLVATVQQLSWASVITVGAYLTVANQLSVGGMIAASILAMRAFNPIQKMQASLMQMQAAQRGFVGLDNLFNQARPTAGNQPIEHIKDLYLDKVCFSYERENSKNKLTLNNISIKVQAGQRICVLGSNGSGKSTLLGILANTLGVSRGDILINGAPLGLINPIEIGRHIGYSPQPASFMQASLFQNLSLGRPWVNQTHCSQILSVLGMAPWLAAHPEGINRPISSQGKNLSAGQRNLLSVARALVSSPSLLLLDEPTVGLDKPSAEALLHVLNQLPQTVCTVIATHDRSLLDWATNVVVLQAGHIAYYGPKEDFIERLNSGGSNA